MKTIINYFKTAPMMNKLTVVLTFVWVFSAVGNLIYSAVTGVSLNEGMNYIQISFTTVLVAFFGQKGVTNVMAAKYPMGVHRPE